MRELPLCGAVCVCVVNSSEQATMPASKDICGLCSKGFYGKQKFIKCVGPCAVRYHLSCVNISEAEYSCLMVNGESTYKCTSCIKNLRSLRRDDTPVKTRSAATEISEAVSPLKIISPDRVLELPPIFEDGKYEASMVLLETIRLNSQSAVDILKTLLDLVHKLNDDVTHLKHDNSSLKLELKKCKELMVNPPMNVNYATTGSMSSQPVSRSMPSECTVSTGAFPVLAKSSVPATSSSADAVVLSYRDVASAGLPSKPDVPTDSEGFVPVVRKKKPIAVSVNNTIKPRRQPLIGVRNSASLPTVVKKERTKALFVSRFCPEVSAADVEKSLKEQLSLKKLICTRLKTKFNTYSSYHVLVLEDEFPLINNTGVWPTGCLIAPFYGKLKPDQMYSPSTPVTGGRSISKACSQVDLGSPVTSPPSRTINNNDMILIGEEASGGSYGSNM